MVRGSKSAASQAQNHTVSIAVPPAANPQRLHPQGGSNSEEEFNFAPAEANESGSEHDVGSQAQTQLTSTWIENEWGRDYVDLAKQAILDVVCE